MKTIVELERAKSDTLDIGGDIMAADFRKAERAAYDTLNEMKVVGTPIDPEVIAEALGVPVRYAKFDPETSRKISGYIDFDPEPEIVINTEIASNRKTFTIAHELAHYILHQDYAKGGDYQILPRSNHYAPGDKPPEEQEADAFAAHLLVPTSDLRLFKNTASVSELAKIFAVSEDVISNRLNWV